ncbi:MAG: TerB family tellurite resistance protein [Rhodobiaceae bacterium]|nr:TerB family tellurite resistance protein [Rhodobiaceae bacterium]
MFKTLGAFINDLVGEKRKPDTFDESDHRLAAAALLFHAISIDGFEDPAEKKKLHTMLKSWFGISDAEAKALVEQARQKDLESVDLHGFTSVLNRSLDDAGKRRVVEMLWEIVYADGDVHEFEDNLIWRVAELLGVSTRERVLLRKQVEAGRDAKAE